MKDYAVQQKKLYEDVTNYCQRNRDAAVQREDLQLREMMAEKLREEQEEEEGASEEIEEVKGKTCFWAAALKGKKSCRTWADFCSSVSPPHPGHLQP